MASLKSIGSCWLEGGNKCQICWKSSAKTKWDRHPNLLSQNLNIFNVA